jgi:UTP--glucose-1-phosphate uridylyltransferase
MTTLESTKTGFGGEIQLTDALLASIGELPFHAVQAAGERFDCGSKVGFVSATIRASLERDDMRSDMRRMIRDLAEQEFEDDKS